MTDDNLIIEGLLTTTSVDGAPHVAPQGPLVNRDFSRWLLRPYQSSTTFANLHRVGVAVFHVIDDVLPVVQLALNMPTDLQFELDKYGGWVIPSACHWYCLNTVEWDVQQPRAEVRAKLVDSGVIRSFWGWNRAKHAVLEASILATRLHLQGPNQIENQLSQLASAVSKTGGERERQAWKLVTEFIQNWRG